MFESYINCQLDHHNAITNSQHLCSSGRCQIVHWRQVHKLECQQLGNDCHRSSLKRVSSEGSRGRVSYAETTEQCTFKYNMRQPSVDSASSEDVISPPLTTLTSATTSGMILSTSKKSVINQRSADIATLLTGQRDSSRTSDGAVLNSSEEVSGSGFTLPNSSQPPEDAYVRNISLSYCDTSCIYFSIYRWILAQNMYKNLFSQNFNNCLLQLREGDFSLSEHHAYSPHLSKNGDGDLIGVVHESDMIERESLNAFDGGNNYGILRSSTTAISGANAYETRMALRKGEYSQKRIPCTDETKGLNCSSGRTSMKRSSKSRIISHSNGIEPHKYPKSRVKVSKEPLSADTNIKVQTAKESSRFIYSCSLQQTPFALPFTKLF